MWKCVWVTWKGHPFLPLALPCLRRYNSRIHNRVKKTWSNCAQTEEEKIGLVCRQKMNTGAAISYAVVRDQWYRETERKQLKWYLHKCSVLQIRDLMVVVVIGLLISWALYQVCAKHFLCIITGHSHGDPIGSSSPFFKWGNRSLERPNSLP